MSITPSYFYHQTTRKAVVLFGTLFNDIHIKKPDGVDIKVPLTYSSKQKWYSILADKTSHYNENTGKVNQPEGITFPRLAYILTSIDYDGARHTSSLNNIIAEHDNGLYHKKVLQPVPYNLSFDLYLISRTMEDGLQIVEQIIPFFTPRLSVTIDEIPDIGITRDVEIVLNSVQHTDDFEGGYDGFVTYTWALRFKMEMNYYGPIRDQRIIKRVITSAIPVSQQNEPELKYNKDIQTVNPFEAHFEDPWTIDYEKIKVEYE